jgi:hypothetical protein
MCTLQNVGKFLVSCTDLHKSSAAVIKLLTLVEIEVGFENVEMISVLENNLDQHVENVPGVWAIVRMNAIET